MLLLVASDLHGSESAIQNLLDAATREKPDQILLLGDLLGAGAGKGDPAAALLNRLGSGILAVRGNCDAERHQDLLEFPMLAETREFQWAGVPVFAAHGHRVSRYELPPFLENAVFLQGHTHIPFGEWSGSVFCANPGSLALPRGGSAPSYLTFDGRVFCWKGADGALFLQREYR